MSEHLTVICAASALAIVVRFLCSGCPLAKQIDGALGIILLLAALRGLLPLAQSVVDKLPELSPPEYEDAFNDTAEQALSAAISEAIEKEFGLSPGQVLVSLEGLDPSALVAEKIEIVLTGSAVTADHRRIRDYTDSLGHGECEVRISFA
jgi:hypothetical protein